MQNRGDVTLYDIVVTDRATGRSRTIEGAPIAGRHKAEEQARSLERNNRNPVLHYSVQPSKPHRNLNEELPPEALLTHKFRVYGR